jgi:hypothetical protein
MKDSRSGEYEPEAFSGHSTKTVTTACREAWASGKVEKIAAVADMLRFQQGLDYEQIRQTFEITTGLDIPLAKFDAIMSAVDEGYSGTLNDLRWGGR